MLITTQPLLQDTNFTCFVIPALFSQQECEALLSAEIKNSFQKAISNYPTYYRNNDRLVLDDDVLAKKLFERVKPYLPEKMTISSSIEAENGNWKLLELNNRLRFCRYSAKQYFNRHLDGVHYRSATVQSKLTFMIYLNSSGDFEGGRTLFYKTKDATGTWAAYIPKQGDLIVFDHNVWHEGEALISGEKFVLRSDILYALENNSASEQPFGGHLGYIWKLLKLNDTTILSGGRDKLINVWDPDGKLLQSVPAHDNSILCLEKMNEHIFISGSRDKQIKVWEQQPNGRIQLKNRIDNASLVLSLCRLTENTFAASAADHSIRIFSLDGTLLHDFTEHTDWVWDTIRISDTQLASCSEDGTIKIRDYKNSNKVVQTFSEDCAVFCLAYKAASRELISANLKGGIAIRNLNDAAVRRFHIHNGIIRSMLLINDQLIATAGEDNKVKITNLETGVCVAEFQHQNFVQSVLLKDHDLLLSASYDGTIKSWELGEVLNKFNCE